MMASKGTKVTAREKKRMWELYQQTGSFTLVGKKMHRSRDTVSRHVREYETACGVVHYLTQERKEV